MTLVRYGSWRWMVAATLAAALTFATLIGLRSGAALAPDLSGWTSAGAPAPHIQPALTHVAAKHPNRQVEVIIQLRPGASPSAGGAAVSSAGGTVIEELPIVNGLGARMTAENAQDLDRNASIRVVSLNAAIKSQGNIRRHHARAHHRNAGHRHRGGSHH